MRYTTVFIDLDDTLLDTAANSREALEEVFHIYSFDKYYPSFSDFYEVFYDYNISLWNAYEKHEIDKEELMSRRFCKPFPQIENLNREKGIEINHKFMSLMASKRKLIEGAVDLLEYLRAKYKICALSNGFREVQFDKIENGGLTKYFDKVVLSDDIGVNKPDPAIFLHALKEMNAVVDKTIMIGDNWSSDILGAKNSGIDQIWYNPGNLPRQGFEPTYTVKNLAEIKNII
ncbi:MAG: YjjG family noncanonical pyrimidine nucleotidase [Dysgonomonas sp.]